MPTDRENIEVLEDALRSYGLTQNEGATAMGVAPQTVNRWLNGRTVLSDRKLKRALTDLERWHATQQVVTHLGEARRAAVGAPVTLDQLNAKLDRILDILETRS